MGGDLPDRRDFGGECGRPRRGAMCLHAMSCNIRENMRQFNNLCVSPDGYSSVVGRPADDPVLPRIMKRHLVLRRQRFTLPQNSAANAK